MNVFLLKPTENHEAMNRNYVYGPIAKREKQYYVAIAFNSTITLCMNHVRIIMNVPLLTLQPTLYRHFLKHGLL